MRRSAPPYTYTYILNTSRRRRSRQMVNRRLKIRRSIRFDDGHLRHRTLFHSTRPINALFLTQAQAMTLLHNITHPSRLHDVKFTPRASGGEGDLLLAGAEDKKLTVYQVSSDPETPPRVIAELIGHDRRCVYVTRAKTDVRRLTDYPE